MNLSDLKRFYRTKIKVIPGGPTDKTRGTGVLAILDTLAEELNMRPTVLPALQTFRYRTQEESVDNYGGQTLDQLEYNTVFIFARQEIEFWRDDPTDLNETPRHETTIAVYDRNAPANRMGWRTSGGPAASVGQIGLQLVLLSHPAATGVVEYDPDDYVYTGQLRYYDAQDGDGAQFYQALQDMSPLTPTPVPGRITAYWQPTARPSVPGSGGYTDAQIDALLDTKGSATVQAQHTQQLATLGVQGSPVYGYLDSSEQPVGYASLDDALADERQKTFMRFNVPSLAINVNNIGAGSFYVNGEGATITLGANVVYTLPGSDIGSLYLQNFYVQGNRGSRINLLTDAPTSTPTALLPRLDGYFATPTWLLNGGAVVLSGYYLSLNGSGTVYAIEPFRCDTIAAGVNVIKASAGTVKTVFGAAPDASGNVMPAALDVYSYSQAKRNQVFGLFTTANQVKAVDVALAGDTSTGIGSRIPDLANGAMYELVADPDNPMNSSSGGMVGTPTWIRY